MNRPGTALALALVLVGCAKSKTEAVPVASASSATDPAPASAPAPAARRIKLCSDGVHKPGDHWKEACNPCRCAADGEITCAHFACEPVDAGGVRRAADAGDAAP